jgi:proline iminopeptidase
MKATLALAILSLAYAAVFPPASTAAPESEPNATPRETRIPVGNADLYSREVGRGPAIIVLHGGPDFDHSYLVPDLDRLSDSYRLIYYDQRGRGRSADRVKPEDVTLASDIADIEKVRQYFKLDSVVLLGRSWGTVLALEYALRYPERVSRLILMNPGPASTDDYKQLRKEWLEKRADDMERRKAISETAAYKEGDPDAVTAYYRIHFKAALARPEDYETIIARFKSSFTKEGILKARAIEARLMNDPWSSPEFDLLPKLKSLRIPTLVISGDHDFIPAATAEHITQAIPNAHMVTLKGCGHFSYLECPDAVREQIDLSFAPNEAPARPRPASTSAPPFPATLSTAIFRKNSAAASGGTVLMNIPDPNSNPATRVNRGITLTYQ